MTVEIGQTAPEFTLKDQAGNDVSLSDYRGKQPVVLVFYPFTFTGVCQGELCEIRDDPSVVRRSPTRRCSRSAATPATRRRSGPSSRASRSRSSRTSGRTVRSPRRTASSTSSSGCANRGTFVIDRDGVVAAKFESAGLASPRAREDYEQALAKVT